MSESLHFATKNDCMEDKKADSLLASPIVNCLYNKKQNYADDDLEVEWVEDYKPGVFINSPTGKKGIKQVNFR